MSEILHIREQILFILTKLQKCGFQGRKTLFWPENDRKWQKMAERHGYSALEATFLRFRQNKKNRHLICKISDIFCLAKYDLRWSWFFDFYLWVSKFLNLQNCIKTCFNYFFLFLSSFLALVEPFLGVSEFLSNILSFFRIA